MLSSSRPGLAMFIAALLLVQPVFAFQSPLSDQAVREAYFLGQRHDGTYERLLGGYMTFLPPPKTGPHISSIAFLTPFIQFVEHSSQQFNYSAQQAAIDHRHQPELIRIVVQIRFTDSYGSYIAHPADSRSGFPVGLTRRPSDFWKDFNVEISDEDHQLEPSSSSGHPDFACDDGGCYLIGATLQFEFPADTFSSDSVEIAVFPPEGDPVSVDFDLTRLR